MTETEFDEAFQDLISRPWPSQKEGARSEAAHASNAPVDGIYPILAAPRVFPDFGARPIGGTHGTHPGTHPCGGSRGGDPRNSGIGPGSRPQGRSLGVSFLGTEPQPNDMDQKGAICLGTCATVEREGAPAPWCHDIMTPDEPVGLGFSHVDISTTAAPSRHDIMTRAA